MMNRYKLAAVIFVVCGLCTAPANAQNFKGAIMAGINASEIQGDEMSGMNKTSAFGGFEVTYPLNENFDIGFELLYSGKGSRRASRQGDTIRGLWFRLTSHYIDIPVSVHYYLNEKVIISAGLGPSYLLGARLEEEWGAEIDTDFLRKWELSSHAGIGYRLFDNMDVFARYFFSALPINKDRPVGAYNPNYIYTGMRNAGVSAGIRFRLGEE